MRHPRSSTPIEMRAQFSRPRQHGFSIICNILRTDYMAEIPGPAVDEEEWSDDEFEGYVDNTDGEPQCKETKDVESTAELDVGKECEVRGIPEYSQLPGINHQCSDAVTPLEIYNMLLTDDILDQIVKQTILYADQYTTSHPVLPHSRVHGWSREPFTREELQKFISLIIVMGLVNLPTLEDHWVTTWPYSSQTCSKVCKQCAMESVSCTGALHFCLRGSNSTGSHLA